MKLVLRENIAYVYFILPFISVVENKIGLIFSILINQSTYKIKIRNNIIKIPKNRFKTLRDLLGCLTFAKSFTIDNKKNLNISFDENNVFKISLDTFSVEDVNLLELLFGGIKSGANFITEKTNVEIRDLTFIISKINERKIVITQSGISFFIDSIHPGNSIHETFIKKIHFINSNIDWENKIIVDVGAECGDTPLYFANLGAKVFAFEALKKHYDFMIDNLSLNPELSKKIVPINAAIGRDGELRFFVSSENEKFGTFGASFVYNKQGVNHKYENVKGFKLSTARKIFNIEKIDLLKMDCKGCEFFLTDEDLINVDKIKIEYSIRDEIKTLEKLLTLLKKNNYYCMLYNHNESSYRSNLISGIIFAVKLKTEF